MSNLIEIQNQIEKLQKQASEIRSKEFDKTVQDILAKMQAFGITLKDLQRETGKGRVGRTQNIGKAAKLSRNTEAKSRKKSISTVAAKYRGPNGEAWSGRGLTPRWLATLIAQGRAKEDFAIKG